MAKHPPLCQCNSCNKRNYPMTYAANQEKARQARQQRSSNNRGHRNGRGRGGYSAPMGGGDSAGNPLTVSFGDGSRENETLIADGDVSEKNFLASENHNHYGSGSGPNDNVKDRGKYTGEGS